VKEDILEQVIEDWLVSQAGWFVKHNVKFRPDHNHPDYRPKQDSVHSDIDILAINSLREGIDRVAVFSCKSWQSGFRPENWRVVLEAEPQYNSSEKAGFKKREDWKHFREIASDKWIKAFVEKIELETGQRDFTYFIAVTTVVGDEVSVRRLEQSEVIRERLLRNGAKANLRVITLHEILGESLARLETKKTPVLEATDFGRFLQLVHAARLSLEQKKPTTATRRNRRKARSCQPDVLHSGTEAAGSV
jgi:hypothetical protein